MTFFTFLGRAGGQPIFTVMIDGVKFTGPLATFRSRVSESLYTAMIAQSQR